MAKKIVNTFENGLVKVDNKTKQPKNSYSYALNTVPNNEITDRTSRVNERGFDEYIQLKEDPYNIIGYQWLGDEQYVFFIKDVEGSSAPFNEIWYVDIKEEIQELRYANLGLNFKEGYPITSTYRTDYRNHRIIYWVDGLNDDRVIDIDDSDVLSLDLSMISMNSSEIKPDISIESEDSGGSVKSGQYFVAAAYQDDINYITGASNFTKPLSISNDKYFNNIPVSQIIGLEYIQTNGIENDVVTPKKIVINVSNIDQRYSKIILYIVQVTNNDTKIFTTSPLTITGSTLLYEFTGLNIEEDTSITINDLVVSRINYYASNVINQKENRLIRGNLKTKESLINYQQIANNIKVNYGIEEELIYDNYIIYDVTGSASPNPNPLFQFSNLSAYAASPEYLSKTGNSIEVSSKTFMRDEVYALGVSFELNDGTETDVFHIPGRTLNSFVSAASGDGEYDRAFINQADWDDDVVNSNPRWLEMNTAIKRGSTNNELAYWRSDDVYPDDYGYPTDGEQDINGDSYIRHHKMPSDVLEPIIRTETTFDGTSVNYKTYRRNIKLVFNNIVIPEEYSTIISKIKLHYVPRNDSNKSIVSKGLFYTASGHSTSTAGSGWKPSPYFNMVRGDISVYQFLSPDIDFRFKQFPISAYKMKSAAVIKGYISYFGEYNPSGGLTGYLVNLVNNYQYELNQANPPHTELLVGTCFYPELAIADSSLYSREIDNIQFIDANSTGNIGGLNGSYVFTGEENTSLLRLADSEELEIVPSNYSLPLNFDNPSEYGVYFDNVNYQALITNGNAGIKTLEDVYYDSVIYGSLIRENKSQYGNPNNLIYASLGTSIINNTDVYNDIEVKNGDCFIDIHYTKKGYSTINPHTGYESRRRSSAGFVITDNIGEIKTNSYIAYYVETDLNIRMRNSDPELPDGQRDYFPLSPTNNSQSTISISRPEYNALEIKSTGSEYFNIYPFYNTNYLKEYFANTKLLSDFNITDNNKYQNRLVYSDKQNYEDKVDNFRVTRANNYKDLPMDRGQITQSFIKDDKFFVLTRDALYNVYASNKTIQSIDNDNIVVGTGEFFGLEPVELISIKGGFGGTSSKYSLSESPYGYLFVDRLKSKAILFNETLKDINVGGLNEDYTLQMYNQFKELELEDKFDNPIIGPGIISTYDPRLHRMLITKKDYIALEDVTDNYQGLFNPEELYEVGDIVAKDGVLVEITDVVIIEEHLIFKTLSTDNPYEFSLNSGGTTITIEARTLSSTVIDSTTGTASGRQLDLSGAVGESDIILMNSPALITSMNVTDGQVTSINSTIYPNLTGITANNNLLTSIDTSNNPSLTQLRVEFNSISSIDVTNNINLTHLFINDNSIPSLDLTNNEDLLYLQADNNNIGTINLANNGELLWCLLGNNGLSTINLSNNPNITWLRVIDNNLTNLDTSFCTGLTRLEAKNNNISSFDFSNNPLIEILDIGDNNLSTLDTSNLSNLEVLYVSRNSISSVNFTNNTGITHIQITENNLSTLDISMLENLESLDCTKNDNLTTLDISNNDNLTSLRCGECDFTEDTADPAIIDAIIIKMDQNITSGGTLQYDTLVPGGVQPTSASLAAYNSLVSKGCNLQGKVPA